MRAFNIKQLYLISIIALTILLQGCASGGGALGTAFEHGFGYCNIGDKTLIYRHLEYGDVVRLNQDTNRHRGGDKNCLGGSVYVAQMPIPETMKIEWQTEGGVRHKVDIPLRSLVTNKHPTRRFKIQFNDDHIQIVQEYFNMKQPYLDASTVIFKQ